MLNCSRPDNPALLEVLRPVFNLSSIRPVQNYSTTTHVTIDIILFGILGVVRRKKRKKKTAHNNNSCVRFALQPTKRCFFFQDEKAQLVSLFIWQYLVSTQSGSSSAISSPFNSEAVALLTWREIQCLNVNVCA